MRRRQKNGLAQFTVGHAEINASMSRWDGRHTRQILGKFCWGGDKTSSASMRAAESPIVEKSRRFVANDGHLLRRREARERKEKKSAFETQRTEEAGMCLNRSRSATAWVKA